jgi:hypothetical protein
MRVGLAAGLLLGGCAAVPAGTEGPGRLRVVVETDAGGDPDDEQSLVRFLLYACEWDVEGIIANRAQARERENRNPERTGLGIVRAQLKAYGECLPRLVEHDPRYPTLERLWSRTVSGVDDEGVRLLVAAADSPDPRPVWFMNWGTDHGSAPSALLRALDLVLRERGPGGYARFKSRFRLSSSDEFGDHTWKIEPPFPLWVDTFRPEIDRKRWYHRFSALTAKAGGFDVERDVRTGHGPLGALYPTNTTHPQKEGDSMSFLYLLPTGMNDPERPDAGSWGGRYGLQDGAGPRRYYWANQADSWQGTTDRDNTVRRWAVALQNDFKARMDWCVTGRGGANHPPVVRVQGSGLAFDASASSDPDGDPLDFEWWLASEVGTGSGRLRADGPRAALDVLSPGELHVVVAVTDRGTPPLTRYRRLVLPGR